MLLARVLKHPSARDLSQDAIGTTYVYRRLLIFAPEPVWFAVVKLGEDRWLRAQSVDSVEAAIAIIGADIYDRRSHVVDDCDSNTMAQRMTRKEVDADGKAAHVGLFMGKLDASEIPRRQERVRPDAAAIAAARARAATPAGAAALAAQLARFTPGTGATPEQLEQLRRAMNEVPPDLRQLLTWSNGHDVLELMSIEEMIEVNEGLERNRLFLLNHNENGDYWGVVTSGPLQGALAYDECNLEDADADAVKANSILDWLEDPDTEFDSDTDDLE